MSGDLTGVVRAAIVNEYARQQHCAGPVDFDRLAGAVVSAIQPPAPRRLWDIFAEADGEQSSGS